MTDDVAYRALLSATGLPVSIIDQVRGRYREPVRTYHDEDHLKAIAARVAKHELQLSQAQAIAILFHDAVYVPGAPHGLNEELSACLLQLMLKSGSVPEETWHIAQRIVRDTADHIPTITESSLVLDLDLLGLAGEYRELVLDSERVFEEVKPLVGARQDYEVRRNAFFNQLLKRRIILHSHELSHLEGRLRENLARAIEAHQSIGTEQ